jgi:hypothetical protein
VVAGVWIMDRVVEYAEVYVDAAQKIGITAKFEDD